MTETEPKTATGLPAASSFSERLFHGALRLAQVLALLTVLLGLIVLAGWALHIEALKSVFPGYINMKANTALCLVFSGASLLIGYLIRRRTWTRTCSVSLALVAAFIAAATLLEYLTNRSFGMDQLFIADSLDSPFTPNPGRMAPNTALAFLLFDAALLCLYRGRRGILLAHCFTLLGLFITLLASIGYLFNAQILNSFDSLTRMAIHTTVGFWMLGIAILCSRPKKGFLAAILANTSSGLIVRNLIAPSIVAPLVFGSAMFVAASV